MSTDKQSSFEKQLQAVYTQHRHRTLESKLEDLAETMEETILQQRFAAAFFETDVPIDDEAKDAVSEARTLIEQNEFDELADELDELEQLVDQQERRVTNQIQERRIEQSDTVNGMKRLNDRVEAVNAERLSVIQALLDSWNWKQIVYREEAEGIDDHKQNAQKYGRAMREFLENARQEIFGPYNDTPVEEIIDGLLNEERLALDELSDEHIEQLRDSDLVSYVELKLS